MQRSSIQEKSFPRGEDMRLRGVSRSLERGSAPVSLIEHDLIGKPVSTFPDHALAHRSKVMIKA
jgi:hypothetical protein